MNKKLVYLIYLLGFPVAGAVFGYLFFLVMRLIGNDLGVLEMRISIGLWFSFGLLGGVYGLCAFKSITGLTKDKKTNK